MLNLLFFIFVHLSVNHEVKAQSRTNFIIKKFDFCSSDGTVQYYGNITTENDKQYIDFTMISSIPMDENIGGFCIIESGLTDKTFVPLFTIREKYFCLALNKYMGEFWYNIERAAQIPVGVCPILQGRYHLHHLLLDYSRISLQTFPFGTLRFTFQAISKMNNNTVFCLQVVAENLSL